jgi:outer membrane protein OmpA-like peptidoglycan-associated protein
MRVSPVLAFVGLVAACGVVSVNAQPMTPVDEDRGVVVNMDALPIPLPRPKPTADELRPMRGFRPRPKPTPEELAAWAATPDPAAQNSVVSTAPLPRMKPALDVAAVSPAGPAPVEAPAPATEAPEETEGTPARPPAAPVVIVSAPTTDTSIGVEIRGVAEDPFASKKPINPVEGFAVLSRVRFSSGKTDIPVQAQAKLDVLVQRLLISQERVRLAGFSGKAGDYSSGARRLSLARALAIRSYLVSKGVAVDRVDVLAFGGATDGVSDRVDVLVRGI